MNADFQDSMKPKMFFGVYLRKSAGLETREIFSKTSAFRKGLPRNPSRPPKGGEVIYGKSMNRKALSPFEKGEL
jgi:hypothetical protein